MDKKLVGEKLKNLRVGKNLSMDKLKDEFNEKYGSSVSKSMISNWENGRHLISNKNLNLYVDYFDIPLSYFTNDNIEPKPPKAVNLGNIFNRDKITKAIQKIPTIEKLNYEEMLIDLLNDEEILIDIFNDKANLLDTINSDKELRFNLINEIVDCLEIMNISGLQKVLNYSKDISKINQYKSKGKE